MRTVVEFDPQQRFDSLIDWARAHPMSDAERHVQAESWVAGQLGCSGKRLSIPWAKMNRAIWAGRLWKDVRR